MCNWAHIINHVSLTTTLKSSKHEHWKMELFSPLSTIQMLTNDNTHAHTHNDRPAFNVPIITGCTSNLFSFVLHITKSGLPDHLDHQQCSYKLNVTVNQWAVRSLFAHA